MNSEERIKALKEMQRLLGEEEFNLTEEERAILSDLSWVGKEFYASYVGPFTANVLRYLLREIEKDE